MNHEWRESLVEKTVTYTLEWKGAFYVVENVPARVDEETGECYFSPDTVEHLQQLIWTRHPPVRMIAVSYTHLDVYKRQADNRAHPSAIIKRKTKSIFFRRE